MSETPSPVLLLSELSGSPVVSPSGERLGRVEDLIARLADGGYPRITGLKVRIGRRDLFIPADLIADLARGRVRLTGQTVNVGRFERRAGEVLLREDVLGRPLIDVVIGRLVNADDLVLAPLDGSWHLAGVAPSRHGGLRQLLGVRRRRPGPPSTVLDWRNVEPFVGHVPTSGLLMPLGRLKRLHPALIADLVERSSHEQGEEIIDAVEADPELSADVFEELDPPHQEEFLEDRSDEEAAALLARMAPDDAADLLNELDQDRRLPVLNLLPAPQRQRVHALLQYHPSTAGGMMSPDYIAVPPGTRLSEALARIREDTKTPASLRGAVVVAELNGQFVGVANAVDLLRGDSETAIETLPELVTMQVNVHADVAEIALVMTDFNLTAVAVTDESRQLIGVISVDDLLEVLVPEDWRRRAQAESGD